MRHNQYFPGTGSLDVDKDCLPANLAIPLNPVLAVGGLNPLLAGLVLGSPPDILEGGGGMRDPL